MAMLIGPAVWPSITTAARATQGAAHVAVAYFGREGPRLLPLRAGSILVVDASIDTVASGSTSPSALRQMVRRGTRVFSAQNLHAKLFVFDSVAFIGSANASRNSARFLIEAVVRVQDAALLLSARQFINDYAITEHDDATLAALESLYRPPRGPSFPPRQARFTTLIMELTLEQGAGRETQVQPPRAVWEHYFGIDFEAAAQPRLRLVHKGPPAVAAAPGTISKHHHNLTIEIPGAEMPRPALLELRKTGRNAYLYEVHRTGPIFDRFAQLLAARANPLWTSGRKWLII